MHHPDHLSPRDLHTAAVALHDRLELLAVQVASGLTPDGEALAALLVRAGDLHRRVSTTLFDELVAPDQDDVDELTGTLALVTGCIDTIARTVEIAALVGRFGSMAPVAPDPFPT